MPFAGLRLGERHVRFSSARTSLLAAAACLVAAWLLAPTAHAYLYWGNNGVDGGGTTIGRATVGGTGTSQYFVAGAKSPKGVAVGGGFVYWSNFAFGTIGRARVDGSLPNQSFIKGVLGPQGVAVDDTYIYWANQGGNAIGRAKLDGTSVNQSFIPRVPDPYGVAVDGAYIYWASGAGGSIGRAVKANPADPDQVFISPAGLVPDGVAVNATHIYWTNYSGNSISRANRNGTGVKKSFIPNVLGPSGIGVNEKYIYWSNYDSGTIGIATLAGTGVMKAFITGASNPWGLAVDALGPLGPEPVLDTTAPVAKLSGSRRQDIDRLAVRVTSSKDAFARARAKVEVRRSGRTRTISFRAASASVKANHKTKLRLKLKRSDMRAVKRALRGGQAPRVKVRVSAVDAANNQSATAKRTITLKD